MRHVEHHRLEEGYHIGTERKVLVHTVLRETGKLGTFLHQFLGQIARLPTLHHPTCLVQPLDIRTQLLFKISTIRAIHRHFRTDFSSGNHAEVDTTNRTICQYTSKISLPLADGGRGIPIETDAYTIAHARSTHTRLSVHVARVEGQAHNLEVRLLVGIRLEGIKLVYLIHLRIKKSFLRFGQSHNERGIRHIRVNLLNHKTFRSLALVLVCPLGLHLPLPFLFAPQVVHIPLADVLQNVVDRLADAVLPCTRFPHQHVHQCGFVQHIVDVAEVCLPQVRSQRREYRMCHGRLVNLGRTADEQLDKWR